MARELVLLLRQSESVPEKFSGAMYHTVSVSSDNILLEAELCPIFWYTLDILSSLSREIGLL
jgi:hypothetical protein